MIFKAYQIKTPEGEIIPFDEWFSHEKTLAKSLDGQSVQSFELGPYQDLYINVRFANHRALYGIGIGHLFPENEVDAQKLDEIQLAHSQKIHVI
jgi:hypothetical protein